MSLQKDQKEPVGWFWVAAAFSVAVLVIQFFLERGANPYFRAAGIICLLLSPIFIFPPFLLLARYGEPPRGKPYFCTTAVVDRGVYAVVRHPQYLGYVLLTLGFAALCQHALISILAVSSAGAFYVQSLQEEAFVRKQPGRDYSEYMRRVPRFNLLAGVFRYLVSRKWRS
jgi:protein-S-isoprenylcysteine O-methyltransferase Ste14